MKNPPHVLAVQDISCVGRCSLTAILPIFAAAGIECSVLPTALLSTHTGGFHQNTFLDLTEQMPAIFAHWQRENITFDALCTGYLGSTAQIDILHGWFAQNPAVMRLVDPVMADHGQLYKGFGTEHVQAIREWGRDADVLTPNMTEAMLLADIPYREGPWDPAFVERLMKRLRENMRVRALVITGVALDEHTLGSACSCGGQVSYALTERLPVSFPGTGDIFSAVVLAAMLQGNPPAQAADMATQFTYSCIRDTIARQSDPRRGVEFERHLRDLTPLASVP